MVKVVCYCGGVYDFQNSKYEILSLLIMIILEVSHIFCDSLYRKILVVVCGGLWRQSPTVEEFGVPRLLGNSKAHQQTTWVKNNGIVMRTTNS